MPLRASAEPGPAHPIPGETKTEDGRPCWTPASLRSWQSKRKIAGNRTHAGDLD